MSSLDKRVAALESRTQPADLRVIITKFEPEEGEVVSYSVPGTMQEWTRKNGETVEELKARAVAEGRRTHAFALVLIENRAQTDPSGFEG